MTKTFSTRRSKVSRARASTTDPETAGFETVETGCPQAFREPRDFSRKKFEKRLDPGKIPD
jgi:hypothetical protein